VRWQFYQNVPSYQCSPVVLTSSPCFCPEASPHCQFLQCWSDLVRFVPTYGSAITRSSISFFDFPPYACWCSYPLFDLQVFTPLYVPSLSFEMNWRWIVFLYGLGRSGDHLALGIEMQGPSLIRIQSTLSMIITHSRFRLLAAIDPILDARIYPPGGSPPPRPLHCLTLTHLLITVVIFFFCHCEMSAHSSSFLLRCPIKVVSFVRQPLYLSSRRSSVFIASFSCII